VAGQEQAVERRAVVEAARADLRGRHVEAVDGTVAVARVALHRARRGRLGESQRRAQSGQPALGAAQQRLGARTLELAPRRPRVGADERREHEQVLARRRERGIDERRHRDRVPVRLAREPARVRRLVVGPRVQERLVRELGGAEIERGGRVDDERGDRGPRRVQTRDITRGEVLCAAQLEHGLARVGVRDHDRRAHALPVLEQDAGSAAVLDEDPAHGRPQQELAAGTDRGRDERVGEHLERPAAVVGAVGDVAREHRREVQERHARRRQPQIGPQRRERGARGRVVDARLEHLRERGAPVAQQQRIALGPRERPRTGLLLGAARLSADLEAVLEEAADPLRLAREALRVRLGEAIELARCVEREAGPLDAIGRIDAREVAALAHAELREQVVQHPAALERHGLAARHEVHGRVEAIAAALERVRVAARAVVALDDQHAPTRAREQRRAREPAEPAADHDRVVAVVRGLLVEAHRPTAPLVRADRDPRARTSP
jgi:hypothetical protein